MIRWNLQTRLFLAVSTLIVVLLAGSLGVIRHYVGRQVRAAARNKLNDSASLFRSTIEQYQERLLSRVHLLAQLPSVSDHFGEHPEQLAALLDEVRRTGAAQAVWAQDARGRVIATTDSRIPVGTDLGATPLMAALQDHHEAGGIFLLGDLWLMAAAAPVAERPSGPAQGAVVLGALLTESWMAGLNELTDAEARFYWQEHWLSTKAWSPEMAQRMLIPDNPQEIATGGRRLMIVETAVPGTIQLEPPIRARIVRPIEMQLVYEIQGAVSTVGFIILILGLVVCLIMTSSITRPVRALVRDTQRIGAGALHHRTRIRGRDEIAQLGQAFNEMVEGLERSHAELQHLNATLEEKVQDRTRALEVAQNQLLQTEKLASIGQLAAGVAHELNNPLMAIMGNAQLSMRLLKQGALSPGLVQELQELLEVLSREAFRSKTIVANLLDFARKQPTTRTPVDIHRLVDDSLKLVGHQASLQNIQIERVYGEGMPQVAVDPHQITQVFVNILINAVQAMPDGGQLAIATRQQDGYLQIAFRDNGCGIAPEHLEKVFDPFFTTKEPGQGTGLGMSVSYGIIQRHQGTIELTSEVGQGTTVTVKLPLQPAA